MNEPTKPLFVTCPRCDGTCEEPGAPTEENGSIALCSACNGKGEVPIDFVEDDGE